jgi:phosphoglycolate phosphatase-like HAD superfamily hydrolase
MDIVQKLSDRTTEVSRRWEEIEKAENVIEQMLKRSDFDAALAALEEDVRRVLSEKSITYIPSQRRLQSEVVEVLDKLRGSVSDQGVVSGPTENQLREILKTMLHHMQGGEYALVLEAFRAVEKDLALAEADPLRRTLVEQIRGHEADARTVLEFEKIELSLDGRAIVDGQAYIMINGKTLGVGDAIEKDLLIYSIRSDEIEFLYKGLLFARRF